MSVRRRPLAVGTLALIAGVVLALGLGPSLSATSRSIAFVAVVVVGGLVAIAALLGRSADGPRADPLPDPGIGSDARVPGTDVDRRLDSIASEPETRANLEDRIERVAVATLARTEHCSPDDARSRLADGTWTDDARAAAFFASDPPSPSIGARVRSILSGEPTARRRATRAIEELHGRTEDDERE